MIPAWHREDGQRVTSYREATAGYFRFYRRVTCLMAIFLILAGTLLDFFYYPQYLALFFIFRLVACALIFFVLLLYDTPFGNRHIEAMTLTWPLVPQVMISAMIAMTGGVDSIYFIGLSYALVGLGVFFPLNIVQATIFSLATYSLYVVACFMGTDGPVLTSSAFGGNSVFLLFFCAMMTTISIYGDRWRRRMHQMQNEIITQHDEIVVNNARLADARLQLVHSEKMASLGTLAAGILHELNNPINYSAIAIKMVPDALARNDTRDALEIVADAEVGIARVKSIISDLKTFAYHEPSNASPLSDRFYLLETVRVACRLTAHECAGTKIALDVADDLTVRGDAASIGSVLINLLSNAAHAVAVARRGEYGSISVSAKRLASERVLVSVEDNGSGISSEHLSRIFEPFFTTKTVGQGLGLGLSVSYAIVERHGSTLHVDSELGRGSRFFFELELDLG